MALPASRYPPFAVLGGGVAGLCVARRLAQRGCEVALIDRFGIGSGASGAAAGILNPPVEANSPFQRSLAAAFTSYPGFLSELSRETGIPVRLERPGMLYLPLDEPEEEALRGKLHRLRDRGRPAAWLEAQDIPRKLPWLGEPWPRGALLLEETARVHPSDLLRALRASLAALGVAIREGFEQVELEARSEGSAPLFDVVLVSAPRPAERLPGRRIVACAGAWTQGILERAGLASPAPIVPVRGQMVELSWPLELGPMVHLEERYLLQPAPGLLWIGATVEDDAGFDASAGAAGIESLLATARRVIPSLGRGDIRRSWAGLRPKVLRRGGAIAVTHPVAILAGHYRSGILAAPRDAEQLVARLLDQETD